MQNKSTRFASVLASAILALFAACPNTVEAQTFKVIHNFGSPVQGPVPEGESPYSGLVFDAAGNLYGTTQHGGFVTCEEHGCGTIFQLTPNGDGTWNENVLTGFQTQNGFGGYPDAPVVFDRLGNLYSAYSCTFDCLRNEGGGALELIHVSQNNWTNVNVVSYFSGPFGAACEDGICTLAFDSSGRLFLSSQQGAFTNRLYGGVVELGHRPASGWYSLVLYGFSGGSDGGNPTLGLVFDASGRIYGTTTAGGLNNMGVLYKLTPNPGGSGWRESVLHTFQGGGSDGAYPAAGVIFDSAGNMYGATLAGGTAALGTIYKMTPNPDGTWSETVLYSFQGGSDALRPNSVLSFDPAGNLYGTAAGGAFNQGAVFKLVPNGNNWTESVVYSFTGGTDGYDPNGGVTIDAHGNLYGTTSSGGGHPHCPDEPFCGGVVYQITP